MKRLTGFMLAIVAGILLLAGNSMAALINGNLELSGLANLTKVVGGEMKPATSTDATAIDFIGDAIVLYQSGTFDLNSNTTAIIRDFEFAVALPIELWAYAGFTFSVNTLSITQATNSVDKTSLLLSGNGTVRGYDYDPSYGTWTLSISGATTKNSGFSFQSSSSVPKPASTAMMFFGAGVVGLVGVTRGRKIKK